MTSVRPEYEAQRVAGPNARLIGKPGGLRELTTPALVLDLEAFEQNIGAYQRQINLHGLRARPHAKSHKCAEIARRQIAAGAVGVCAASLHEAEAMVAEGIDNILITSPVVGAGKLDRLLRLLQGELGSPLWWTTRKLQRPWQRRRTGPGTFWMC